MRQKRTKGFLKRYLQSISPPYTSKDIIPILTTIALLFITYIGLRPVLANMVDAESPSQPKILIGNESPLVIPFTHSEQKSVHLFWTQSSDNVGVGGYRIYKNDTKIGETTKPQYDDYNTFGEAFYAIEAIDAAGNASKSEITRIFLPENWCNCADADDAVMAGFIVDKSTGQPLSKTLFLTITSKTLKQSPPHPKLSPTSSSSTDGRYTQVFKEVTTEGVYQITLGTEGYLNETKEVSLRPGLSTHQDWSLTPKSPKGNRK